MWCSFFFLHHTHTGNKDTYGSQEARLIPVILYHQSGSICGGGVGVPCVSLDFILTFIPQTNHWSNRDYKLSKQANKSEQSELALLH